ncbi:MAG: lytic murein transglycosylase [Alphaproteobacteria bacterium]
MRNLLIALVLLQTVSSGIAAAATDIAPGFGAWLDEVRKEALERGIKPNIVRTALAGIKPVRRIIKHDRNQAEFKLTLDIYQKRVVTPRNIKRGQKMARRHADLLKAVAEKYGVQPRFILAIWGIETRFGAVTANMPLIPAVATLAFDRRRSKYFRAQLFAALTMLDRGFIELKNLKGSWAGAMGQPQFMPSSYVAYAQDFDGDGRRDIWNNTGDVLASIANYLARHGWRDGLTWGRAVTLPAGLAARLGPPGRRASSGCRARTSQSKKLADWQVLGVRRADGADLPTRDLDAVLVLPSGASGPAFLVYRNYAAIMGYNCAHLYALTVGVLSDRIRGG